MSVSDTVGYLRCLCLGKQTKCRLEKKQQTENKFIYACFMFKTLYLDLLLEMIRLSGADYLQLSVKMMWKY